MKRKEFSHQIFSYEYYYLSYNVFISSCGLEQNGIKISLCTYHWNESPNSHLRELGQCPFENLQKINPLQNNCDTALLQGTLR